MIYRNLGKSGLKVSVIGIGNWVNSDKKEDLERNEKIIAAAWSLGINFFDTAESYGKGEGEKQMSSALKKLGVPRSNYVLTTKIYLGFQPNSGDKLEVNQNGLSRKHIIEGLNRSLQNLDEKYVDIVYAHRYDLSTPMEEICLAFNQLIKEGKALYWGTSEWPAVLIIDAIHTCDKLNLIKPIADQCLYNILERELVDKDYFYLFQKFGYGVSTYSPLANGVLSGKYNNGIPPGSRLDVKENSKKNFYAKNEKINLIEKLKQLQEIAESLNAKMSQLAMAWILYNKDVSTAITGATSIEQLEETVKSIELLPKLNKELLDKIESIFQNKPELLKDFKTLNCDKFDLRREMNQIGYQNYLIKKKFAEVYIILFMTDRLSRIQYYTYLIIFFDVSFIESDHCVLYKMFIFFLKQ